LEIPVEPIPLGSVPIIPLNSPQNHPENIEDDDMKDCYDLLVKIMENPLAEAFLEPVDYIALDLWQYPQLIKHPMDLSTVKKMLEHACLENPGHFAEHVKLVFKNAIEFNQPGSDIYNDAENLLRVFEENFKQLCDKWATEIDPEKEDKKDTDNEEKDKIEIEELQQNINNLKTNIANLKKTD